MRVLVTITVKMMLARQPNSNLLRLALRLAVLLGARPGELDIDLSPATFKPIDVSIAIGGADEVLSRRPDITNTLHDC